jgi:hypothetical protein
MANGTQNRHFVIRTSINGQRSDNDDTTYPLSHVYRHVDLRKKCLEEIASFPSATIRLPAASARFEITSTRPWSADDVGRAFKIVVYTSTDPQLSGTHRYISR